MAYWLFKSEPSAYSLAALKVEGTTCWNGVRNYQARNYMMAMQSGDEGFFYHSNTEVLGIIGTVAVTRPAYPDYTALDPTSPYHDPKATAEKPIWQMVDIAFRSEFLRPITLAELKRTPGLEAMVLLQKGSRLSVQPVTSQQWQIICSVGSSTPG